MLPTPRRVSARPLVTVCGSFNRHLAEIKLAVEELFDYGAVVLSPERPVSVSREFAPGFLLLDSDLRFKKLSVRAVEDRHLAAIMKSDFVVLVCPDGYLGCAVAGEMGAARAVNVPLYAEHTPIDDKLGPYVYRVPSLQLAVANHRIHTLPTA
ncbi:MAG TPA: hypothetical protein VGB97_00230 [Candidatus Paceibacterota bacterium]|jgi:hypothetical protein